MKRLTILLLLAGFAFSVSAQTRIDFFDLADSFDWNLSKSEFVEKYKDRVIISTDTIPDAGMDSYVLGNVFIGGYRTMTIVQFDAQTQRPMLISLPTDSLGQTFFTDKAEDVERIVEERLGSPDPNDIMEDMEITAYEGLLGYKTGDVKVWDSAVPMFLTVSAGEGEQRVIAVSAVSRNPDFRRGYWGDSMEEIMRKEGKADESDIEGMYSFKNYVAGMECLCAYRFTDNKLTSGKYIFTKSNSDNCVDNYDRLVRLLIKKYGEPFSNDKKSDASYYDLQWFSEGELVEYGKMSFTASWNTDFSVIFISLDGEQGLILLSIEYYSSDYLFSEDRDDDILEDL